MATYSTDFSEYSTGSAPSDWTNRWATSWTTQVETSALLNSFGGNMLELAPSADARKLLSWDDIDADAHRDDVEILCRFQLNGTSPPNNQWLYLFGRGSGAAASENSYQVYLNATSIYIAKYVSGTSTALVNQPISNFGDLFNRFNYDDIPWWLRFRINGTSLKAKLWPTLVPEPYQWQLETTDSDVTGTGWVGLGNFDSDGSKTVEVDYFVAGTNGDTVALPVATTGNAQLNAEHLEVAYTEDTAGIAWLNGMHTEVAYTEDTAGIVWLNGMHLEVAYSEETSAGLTTYMLDSFEAYTTYTNLLQSGRWKGYTGAFTPNINQTGGRGGGHCLAFINGTSNFSAYTELPDACRTVVVGFAVKWEFLPDTVADGPLLLNANYSWDRAVQLSLSVGTNGKLDLFRGTVGSLSLIHI